MNLTIFIYRYILTAIFCCLLFCQSAHRLDISPYPVSTIPDTLYIFSDSNFNEHQIFTIESLQGLLAREKPEIYRIRGNGSIHWLDELVNSGVLIPDYSLNNFSEIISHFNHVIEGYVFCNLNDNSTNAAISMCSVSNAVVVTSVTAPVFQELGIPLIHDVRNLDEGWVYSNYGNEFNEELVIVLEENKFLHLADYSIFSNAFHFNDPPDSWLTNSVYSSMAPSAPVLGWSNIDEFDFIYNNSLYSILTQAANYSINLSTFTNLEADLHQIEINEIETVENTHTVCFLMSDGDNLQYLMNDFATSENWYASPFRGQIDLGWTISPAFCELAPNIMNYLYEHASNTESGRDYFIAGPSGMGYIFPDGYPDVANFADITNLYMAKADLNIVNVLGNNLDKLRLPPYLLQHNIEAIFYYGFSDYSDLDGDIFWLNGKPVIGGRRNLWEGFETPSSLASYINSLPTDPNSKNGYSLIPVHVWTRTVEDVVNCANELNNNVRVVAPDEFVQLIQQNLGSQLEEDQFNGNSWYVSSSGSDITGTGNETFPLQTIQFAVNMAADFDSVIVLPGVYTSTNTDVVDLGNKSIYLFAKYGPQETIVDGENVSRCFRNNFNGKSIIDGFTVQNGYSANWNGAGIFAQGSVLYRNMIIQNCSAPIGQGGGIYFENNTNFARIEYSLIKNNTAARGGGVSSWGGGYARVKNCTIINNHANTWGGGASSDDASRVEFLNCIIWGNSAPEGEQLFEYENAELNTNYSTIEGGYGGIHCYTVEPDFCDADNGNYFLNPGSQLAELGFGNEFLGAYPEGCDLVGDLNIDGVINIVDVVILIGIILDNSNPSINEITAGDLNGDQLLNVIDVVLLVQMILGV